MTADILPFKQKEPEPEVADGEILPGGLRSGGDRTSQRSGADARPVSAGGRRAARHYTDQAFWEAAYAQARYGTALQHDRQD